MQFVSGPERSTQCSPVCFVTSSETLNVPPYCQMCLPAKVSQNAGRCKSNSMQCSPGGTSVAVYGPAWSHVAHSIIDAAATHTMVQVLNPGFAPVTVYKDEINGYVKTYSGSC